MAPLVRICLKYINICTSSTQYYLVLGWSPEILRGRDVEPAPINGPRSGSGKAGCGCGALAEAMGRGLPIDPESGSSGSNAEADDTIPGTNRRWACPRPDGYRDSRNFDTIRSPLNRFFFI